MDLTNPQSLNRYGQIGQIGDSLAVPDFPPRVIANGDGSVISWEADYRPYGTDKVISRVPHPFPF